MRVCDAIKKVADFISNLKPQKAVSPLGETAFCQYLQRLQEETRLEKQSLSRTGPN